MIELVGHFCKNYYLVEGLDPNGQPELITC
jgi:hypothetical protein